MRPIEGQMENVEHNVSHPGLLPEGVEVGKMPPELDRASGPSEALIGKSGDSRLLLLLVSTGYYTVPGCATQFILIILPN